MNRSSLGLAENAAAALSYVLGWVTGLIFLLLETRSEYVRFHARQSVFTFGGLTLVAIFVSAAPVFGGLFMGLLWILTIVLLIMMIIKAYQGERYKLPLVGDWAERIRVPGEPPLNGDRPGPAGSATSSPPPDDKSDSKEEAPAADPPEEDDKTAGGV